MGVEISHRYFEENDYERFHQRQLVESRFVSSLFARKAFDNQTRKIGYELELCLVDKIGQPCNLNHEVIAEANTPQLGTELGRFNLEINSLPFEVTPDVFDLIEADLTGLYQHVEAAASKFDAQLGLFGVLPSLGPEHLDADGWMSELNRYEQISEQLMNLRGAPISLQLQGEEYLEVEKNDVMLEALGTALQVHLQVPYDETVATYHAGLWASMLILGAVPNSPLVFEKRCWQESRIGIFPQTVDTRNFYEARDGFTPRVHFGKGYIKSLLELFDDNAGFSPILPEVTDQPISELHHFNLHNGTIWRWIRPVLDQNPDGEYHLRLELRVAPAGPTIADTIANMVFFIGLIEGLKQENDALTRLDFATLESDFYAAARYGMQALVHWIDGHQDSLKQLIQSRALPLAQAGLRYLDIENTDKWLSIIEDRVASEQTGANWILHHWKHHADASALVRSYLLNAKSGTPVHLWPSE